MDMGRPDPASGDRVGAGLDGLEGVDSVFVGHGLAEAQEVRVLRRRVRIGGVDIAALGVRLPDLDHGAPDGPAILVRDPPRHVDDVALWRPSRARDGSQVTVMRHRPRAVIGVQIEGAFFLMGRFLAQVRQRPSGDGESSPGDQSSLQNVSPRDVSMLQHGGPSL